VRRAGFCLFFALVAVAGCMRKPVPSADRPPPPPPDLTGATVMVLPVQPGDWVGGGRRRPAPAALEAELAYWLEERAPRVRWTFPPALEKALARSPALDIRLRELAVSSFLRMEVERIGDPLYGDLRRLGALADARYALVPVAANYVEYGDGPGHVEVAAALIDTIGGAVLWFGVVKGESGPADDPAAAATAAAALARALFP
jgi:hypothetical protein